MGNKDYICEFHILSRHIFILIFLVFGGKRVAIRNKLKPNNPCFQLLMLYSSEEVLALTVNIKSSICLNKSFNLMHGLIHLQKSKILQAIAFSV